MQHIHATHPLLYLCKHNVNNVHNVQCEYAEPPQYLWTPAGHARPFCRVPLHHEQKTLQLAVFSNIIIASKQSMLTIPCSNNSGQALLGQKFCNTIAYALVGCRKYIISMTFRNHKLPCVVCPHALAPRRNGDVFGRDQVMAHLL